MPPSNNYNYILVMVDGFSRYIQAYPLSKNSNSKQVLEAFKRAWVTPFGAPNGVRSDRDVRLQAAESAWRKGLRNLGTEVKFSTPRRPQTNGLVERANRRLGEVLKKFSLRAKHSNWEKLLALAVTVLNRQIQKSTRKSAFEIFMRRQPNIGFENKVSEQGDGEEEEEAVRKILLENRFAIWKQCSKSKEEVGEFTGGCGRKTSSRKQKHHGLVHFESLKEDQEGSQC